MLVHCLQHIIAQEFSLGSRQHAQASRPAGFSLLRMLAKDTADSAKNITIEMALNQWVPGSSPGWPTIQSTETRRGRPAYGKAYFRPVFRDREAALVSLRIALVS